MGGKEVGLALPEPVAFLPSLAPGPPKEPGPLLSGETLPSPLSVDLCPVLMLPFNSSSALLTLIPFVLDSLFDSGLPLVS